MKFILTLVVSIHSFSSAVCQNYFVANSNAGATGGTNVFTGGTALTDAIGAASNGDVIYVVPSGVSYGTVTVDKEVSLIGGGFNPDKAGGAVSTITSLGVQADNVRLAGLVVSQTTSIFGTGRANIFIDKCRMKRIMVPNANSAGNVVIQKSIIGENETANPLYLQSTTNVTLSNNIIYHADGTGAAIQGLSGGAIGYNLFVGYGGAGAAAFQDVTLCSIQNNVFLGVTPVGLGTFTDNDQQNNLTYTSDNDVFVTVNGNTSVNNKEAQDPMFTNVVLGTTFSFSFDLTPLAGSPLLGAATDGTDIGVFGGLNPYDIYGTPLPLVRAVTAPNTVSQGSNMSVRVEAKGN